MQPGESRTHVECVRWDQPLPSRARPGATPIEILFAKNSVSRELGPPSPTLVTSRGFRENIKQRKAAIISGKVILLTIYVWCSRKRRPRAAPRCVRRCGRSAVKGGRIAKKSGV